MQTGWCQIHSNQCQPPADQDNDRGDPCQEDDEFFDRPAVVDGSIKCLNLRESADDGDQDLNLWIREVEDVCREIMEDTIFKGNQNFHFEMDLDKFCKRMFGCEANAGVSFQIGQVRYILAHDEYIPVHT
jgi:hypothetical protein